MGKGKRIREQRRTKEQAGTTKPVATSPSPIPPSPALPLTLPPVPGGVTRDDYFEQKTARVGGSVTNLFRSAMTPEQAKALSDTGSTISRTHDHNVLSYYHVSTRFSLQEYSPDKIRVYFDVINNHRLNARAFEAFIEGYNTGFIGVFEGGIRYISAMFRRMMSDPTVLPDIGDITLLDAASLKPLPILGEDVASVDDIPMELVPYTLPETINDIWYKPIGDPVRRSMATTMARFALHFLYDHELGHVLNGHLRFYAKQNGRPLREQYLDELDELEWDSRGADRDALVSQTLEFDADSYAANRGAGAIIHCHANPGDVPEEDRLLFADPRQAVRIWAFSIGCLIRLIGFKAFEPMKIGPRQTHPPGAIRFHTALLVAARRIDESSLGMSQKEFLEIAVPVINDVIAAYASMSGTAFSLEVYEGLLIPWNDWEGFSARLGLYHTCWREEIHPILKDLACTKIAEPQRWDIVAADGVS